MTNMSPQLTQMVTSILRLEITFYPDVVCLHADGYNTMEYPFNSAGISTIEDLKNSMNTLNAAIGTYLEPFENLLRDIPKTQQTEVIKLIRNSIVHTLEKEGQLVHADNIYYVLPIVIKNNEQFIEMMSVLYPDVADHPFAAEMSLLLSELGITTDANKHISVNEIPATKYMTALISGLLLKQLGDILNTTSLLPDKGSLQLEDNRYFHFTIDKTAESAVETCVNKWIQQKLINNAIPGMAEGWKNLLLGRSLPSFPLRWERDTAYLYEIITAAKHSKTGIKRKSGLSNEDFDQIIHRYKSDGTKMGGFTSRNRKKDQTEVHKDILVLFGIKVA